MNNDLFPSDNREPFEYKTRYDKTSKRKILRDAIYLLILFVSTFILLYFNYVGLLSFWLHIPTQKITMFSKYMYCILSGLLGGTTFGMKYFYRAVARGFWNEDRVYWRFFSPLISISLSFVISCIMIKDVSSSNTVAVSIGFLTGYFSDEAVSKMYDVACVLFLTSRNNSCISNKEDGNE